MIQFPNAVKNIAAEDSNFEFLTSNTLKNCYLPRRKNIVTVSKAIIFVNTCLRGNFGSATGMTKILADYFKFYGLTDIEAIERTEDVIRQYTFLALTDIEYEEATERTEHYIKFFKILGFDSIIVLKDLTKSQILEQLSFLKSEVSAFSNDQ